MQALRIVPWVAVLLAGSVACCVARKRMTLVAGSGAASLVGVGVVWLAGELVARGLPKPTPPPQ